MQPFEIIFFKQNDGSCPILDFFDTLDEKMYAKILKEIKLLKECGTNLREPYTKHLSDGIFELRAKQGSNIVRALYFFVIGNKIVFTNGFVKKTQKTPKNEITLAQKYRNIYLSR